MSRKKPTEEERFKQSVADRARLIEELEGERAEIAEHMQPLLDGRIKELEQRNHRFQESINVGSRNAGSRFHQNQAFRAVNRRWGGSSSW